MMIEAGIAVVAEVTIVTKHRDKIISIFSLVFIDYFINGYYKNKY